MGAARAQGRDAVAAARSLMEDVRMAGSNRRLGSKMSRMVYDVLFANGWHLDR